MTDVQSLIVCVSGFTDESFVALKAKSVELAGADIVRADDELQLALGQSGYLLILNIYNNSNDAIDPVVAMVTVVEYGGDATYVASDDGLTASWTFELINGARQIVC